MTLGSSSPFILFSGSQSTIWRNSYWVLWRRCLIFQTHWIHQQAGYFTTCYEIIQKILLEYSETVTHSAALMAQMLEGKVIWLQNFKKKYNDTYTNLRIWRHKPWFLHCSVDSAAISGVVRAREQVFKKIANSNIFSSSTWKKSGLFREDCLGSSS